ncbi:MAG: hypothetical protein ABI618_10050, partial [Nitrospirota bacterium]
MWKESVVIILHGQVRSTPGQPSMSPVAFCPRRQPTGATLSSAGRLINPLRTLGAHSGCIQETGWLIPLLMIPLVQKFLWNIAAVLGKFLQHGFMQP